MHRHIRQKEDLMAKAKILVVEDNEIMLDGIQDILEMADYEVVTALDGQEALEWLSSHRPELIVSDIMMPRMDGYQLFSAVRANPKWIGIPFIFLTAKDQRIDVRLGKQLGADDYLTKPFEPEDLVIAVEAKLERAAVLQAATEAEISRLKQNILNTLSHEFRTPLTYIRGYLDLILEEGSNQLSVEELNSFLQRVKRGSDRLRQLVDDFIFLVMLETGEAMTSFRWERMYFTSLRSLIEVVVQQKMPLARARDVQLHADLSQPLPGVVLHVDYFKDALERLIDNAIKFSAEEDGKVWVRATSDEEWVYISIQDNGVGITPEEIPHLFKRLHQINREMMEQPGIGAGLAITKAVIELHDGRIEVESQVGEGSTFTVVLPVGQEEPDML
jgi:two-component system sensor histidine kinase/response regulator